MGETRREPFLSLGFHKYVATLVNAGIQIPHGLNMPVSIAYTESRGAGRLHVYGKTTAQLFPNKNVVIPAGTEVEGEAVLGGGSWTIHWDEVNIRGVHAADIRDQQRVGGKLARQECNPKREVRTVRVRRMEMNRQRVLLVGVAILGVFSAAGLLATNFQIYEISAGNYAEAMWPGTGPTITWNENFTSTPANVVENSSGVTPSTVLSNAFSTWANAQPTTARQ